MYRVAVLMSTYNGEKYIKEQIDSILLQETVEVTLMVRDDGSSDRTIEIIKEYQKSNGNIKLDIGKNVGVGNSFMQLVYDAGDEYDYYAFADQDDVWLHRKLINAINKIENREKPALYTSNQILVNSELEKIGMRYSAKPDTSFRQTMCQNKVSGCTMVWNKTLQKLLINTARRPTAKLLRMRIHDVWVAMVADVAGEIIYDNEGYILYRQHDNNVVGVRKPSLIKQWIEKIKDPEQRNGRSIICKEIFNGYKDLNNPDIAFIEMCGNYQKNANLKRKLLQDSSIISHTNESRVGFVVKVMTNLF